MADASSVSGLMKIRVHGYRNFVVVNDRCRLMKSRRRLDEFVMTCKVVIDVRALLCGLESEHRESGGYTGYGYSSDTMIG